MNINKWTVQSLLILKIINFPKILTLFISNSFRNIWLTSRLAISCTSASSPSVNRFTVEWSINATFVKKYYSLSLAFPTRPDPNIFFSLTNIELLLHSFSFCVVLYLYVE